MPSIDKYKKFGFYWPTQDDLVKLGTDRPDFRMEDLVLEKICWKRQGCGFSMLQLVFRNGISSPVFTCHGFNAEDYITSVVKPGEIKCIKLKVFEKKICEKFQLLYEKIEGKDADKKDILGKADPCNCGTEEFYMIDQPARNKIVGIFGIMATDSYCLAEAPIRHFDNIRGLGFITMNITA